jgi:energy-coupling factor transporter ATP-binding protein EcfA2
MKNLSLSLAAYARFSLPGIREFGITMTDPFQVILGTNGCGKSSLLEHLGVPIVPSHKDFAKTGEYTRVIEHNNKRFTLKATFNPSPKHYFEVDGQVLNDWGTGGVQKDLIKTYFGVDQKYHSLLSGQERFHLMPAAKRREWFMEICETDYSYAMGVYQKLKDKHRDVLGALRTEQRRLAQETQKLVPQQQKQALEQEVKLLQDYLQYLLECRVPSGQSVFESGMNRKARYTALDNSLKKILSLKQAIPGWDLRHYEGVKNLIKLFEQKLSASQAMLSAASKEHERVEALILTLSKAGAQSAQQLEKQITSLQDKIEAIESTLSVDLQDADPKAVIHSLDRIEADVLELHSVIPDNTDARYSATGLAAARQELDQLTVKKNQLEQVRVRHQERIRHIESHQGAGKIACPKCSHTFSPMADAQALQALQRQLLEVSEEIENKLIPKIQDKNAYISQCLEIVKTYRAIVALKAGATLLSPYWTQWERLDVMRKPHQAVELLQSMRQDLDKQLHRAHLKEQLNAAQAAYKAQVQIGQKDIESLKQELQTRHHAVDLHTQHICTWRQRINDYGKIAGYMRSLQDLQTILKQQQEAAEHSDAHLLETVRIEHYNRYLTQIQTLLGDKQHAHNAALRQDAVVQQLQDNISQYTQQEAALALAVKTLSPTDGLIASAMTGFIQVFVQEMNRIIEHICTYSLQIQPCTLEEGSDELNYKFPVLIEGDTVPRPDVQFTSKGQKELIDLAFLITAMCYLRMTDYPLVLDEIGSSFDVVHRTRLNTFLQTLVNSSSFEQVIMVSHDPHQYLNMSAQICVLDPSNITVPQRYNEHVTMK